MLDLELSVAFLDGRTITVKVPPAVQVAFERHFKLGIPALGDKLRLEHLYWMAWETLRKRGDNVPDFETWLDTVASIVDSEALQDPTDPAL
jgi:hypothetical protein